MKAENENETTTGNWKWKVETQTGNRNWKYKLEIEIGMEWNQKMHQSLVQCFLCGLMSSVLCQCSCILLSNVPVVIV